MPFHGVFNYNDPSEADILEWCLKKKKLLDVNQQTCTTKTEKAKTSKTAAMVD